MLNQYFNHTNEVSEQDLNHDLTTELIQMSGIDTIYIPVENIGADGFNEIFGENRFEVLSEGTTIEMRFENMEMPFMQSDIFTKFGLSMSHTAILQVGFRRFHEVFGERRPTEGDYVYIKNWRPEGPNIIFRVLYADKSLPQDQFEVLGTTLYYALKVERATYSHQEVQTDSDDLKDELLAMFNENSVENDAASQNNSLQDASNRVVKRDIDNIFGNM